MPFHIEEQDTYSIVKRVIPEGKTTCGLCSRLRRGILYRVADELGATKVALGHHRDDMLQTFFLNMFFAAKLKSHAAQAGERRRPAHRDPAAGLRGREGPGALGRSTAQFPIIPCTLCGSQENLQRKQVGEMLREWERKHPGRIENMFNALQNVVPSHLLDGTSFDFKGLKATGVADAEGDKAFDAPDFPPPFAASHRAALRATAAPLRRGDSHETCACCPRADRRPHRLRHPLGGRQRGPTASRSIASRAGRRHLPLRAPALAAGRRGAAAAARGDGRRRARTRRPAPRRRRPRATRRRSAPA